MRFLKVAIVVGWLIIWIVLRFVIVRLSSFLRIGFKGLRIRKNELQTAMVHYRHPVTGRKVVFIGVVHQAEREYFCKIQNILNEFSNKKYKVIYEGFKPMKQKHERRLRRNEKIIFRMVRSRTFPKSWSDAVPVVCQKEELVYEKKWINADISELDFIRLMALKGAASSIKDFESRHNLDRSEVKWAVNNIFKSVIADRIFEGISGLFFRRKKMWNEIILTHRNAIAAFEIAKNLRSSDVVTIWGAGHLKGIENHLKDMGFQEEKKEWLTAYHIQKYSYRDFCREKREEMMRGFLVPFIDEISQKK